MSRVASFSRGRRGKGVTRVTGDENVGVKSVSCKTQSRVDGYKEKSEDQGN